MRWILFSRASFVWIVVVVVILNRCLVTPLELTFPPLTSPSPLLGQTTLKLGQPAALGTWSWGNKLLYEYDEGRDNPEILKSFRAARKLNVNLFDTGDSYGTGKLQGNAERLLREGYEVEECENSNDILSSILPARPPIFLSKIAVYPWLLTSDSYYRNIMSSRERLGIRGDGTGASFVPSIHWSPNNYNPFQTSALYEALAQCYTEGYSDGVGLSNLGSNELLKAAEYFQRKNVPIAANQIQCSLVSDFERDVKPALEVANEAGITTLGYSPLGLGLLCSSQQRTARGKLRSFVFDKIVGDDSGRELLEAMTRIAKGRRGGEVSQVALNWVKKQGLTVLFGGRSEDRVMENIKGINGEFELTNAEFEELEEWRRRLKVKGTRNVFLTS